MTRLPSGNFKSPWKRLFWGKSSTYICTVAMSKYHSSMGPANLQCFHHFDIWNFKQFPPGFHRSFASDPWDPGRPGHPPASHRRHTDLATTIQSAGHGAHVLGAWGGTLGKSEAETGGFGTKNIWNMWCSYIYIYFFFFFFWFIYVSYGSKKMLFLPGFLIVLGLRLYCWTRAMCHGNIDGLTDSSWFCWYEGIISKSEYDHHSYWIR